MALFGIKEFYEFNSSLSSLFQRLNPINFKKKTFSKEFHQIIDENLGTEPNHVENLTTFCFNEIKPHSSVKTYAELLLYA